MIEATHSQVTLLRGRRILVVEDEYMIAQEMAEMLLQAGAEPLGPVRSAADALDLVAGEPGHVDAALLDVNLRDGKVWPLVDVLSARGVPVVLATGYDALAMPDAYAALPRCEKPTSPRDLTRILGQVLTS